MAEMAKMAEMAELGVKHEAVDMFVLAREEQTNFYSQSTPAFPTEVNFLILMLPNIQKQGCSHFYIFLVF